MSSSVQGRFGKQAGKPIWVGVKIKPLGHLGTAGFSLCFHLPGQPILGVRLFLATTAIWRPPMEIGL